MYREEEYLMLSGIQHFHFCRRQWALIHIEQLWQENLRTIEGQIQHERVHDSSAVEKRGDLLILRDMRIASPTLGVSGACDAVEFHACPDGITLSGWEGTWQPYPVEYKHGQSKTNDADRLQLCGQAMCLEEMLCCEIPEGALFYKETRRREVVVFTEGLRQLVRDDLEKMHLLYQKGYTPKVKPTKSCNACSLKELCVPKLMKNRSVKAYLKSYMEEEV